MSEKQQLSIKKILLAIDKSGYREKATSYALALAKSFGAEVIVTHVIDKPSMIATPHVLPSAGIIAQREIFEASQKDARKLLKDIVQLGQEMDVVVHEEILSGFSVQQTILEFARNKQVDLIVIGTRGMTGIARFLMGSVASDVIAQAHCPVLAVR